MYIVYIEYKISELEDKKWELVFSFAICNFIYIGA